MNSGTIFKIAIAIFILSLLGGIFFWYPKLQEFLILKDRLANRIEAIKQKQEYFSKLEKMSEELKNYPPELAKIDSGLATDTDTGTPALIKFMTGIVSENGLLLSGMSISPGAAGQENAETKDFPFSIQVTGSYAAFKNLLSALYNNSRIFEVDSIGFNSGDNPGLFNFSAGIRTHFYSSEKPIEIKPTIPTPKP